MHAAHVSVSALQEQFQRAMFTTSILIFALIAVHAQAFALWVQSIRLTNNRISKSNYGDDITDAVPVFSYFPPCYFCAVLFFFFFLPPFFLRSFCADRYSLQDFVPIKRFRWYQVYQLRRFVPQKRFKRYEGGFATCFVRGKRFKWNRFGLSDGVQAVGFYAIPFRTELRPSAIRFSPSSRSSRGHARLMRMKPSPASPYIEPALTWTLNRSTSIVSISREASPVLRQSHHAR